MKHIVAIALSSILAACGGGGSEDASQSEQVKIAASVSADVLVLGDSTRSKYWKDEPSMPELIEGLLGRPVLSLAVPGTSATDAPLDAICASSANVVTANYGLNDIATTDPEQYRDALTAIVREAKACGKRVVLEEANGFAPSTKSLDAQALDEYEAIKRDVASATGATYCALPAHTWSSPDGVHPRMQDKEWQAPILAECIRSAK